MYDCEADDIDELSFRTGDIIVVVEEIDDSWWVSSDLQLGVGVSLSSAISLIF